MQLGHVIFAELAQRLGQDTGKDQRARAVHFLAVGGEPVAGYRASTPASAAG